MESFLTVRWTTRTPQIRRTIVRVDRGNNTRGQKTKVRKSDEATLRKQGLRSHDIRVRQIDHDPKDALANKTQYFRHVVGPSSAYFMRADGSIPDVSENRRGIPKRETLGVLRPQCRLPLSSSCE